MASVLVVDDERSYCEHLQRALERDGHRVTTATSGEEAIETGLRLWPDVLVVDWMLRDDLHGLHVTEALRVLRPDLGAVLITGFPSYDLEESAQRARFVAFVEKPFELESIRAAVDRAARRGKEQSALPPLGLVDLDAEGRIRRASAHAAAMLAETSAGSEASRLEALFEPDAGLDLEAAHADWVALEPHGAPEGSPWKLRASAPRPDGGRWLALRREGEDPAPGLVEMLLGVTEPRTERWPFRSRVLVVDDERLVRRLCTAMLEQVGASAYAAESYGEALRLVEADPGIEVVVLDYEMPEEDLDAMLRRLRALRPSATLVGTSGAIHRADFAVRGIERYLPKPWRAVDLMNVLEL